MTARRMSNAFKTIVLPLTLFAVFAVSSLVQPNPFLSSGMLLYLLRTVCTTMMIALAFCLHMMAGGFDFSLGAIVYLSIILAGNIATASNLGPWGMLVLSMVFGVLFSLLNGVLYILLRMPPMVVSLAMLMIYEALTQLVFGGSGLRIMNKINYASLGKPPWVYVLCVGAMVVVWFVLKYTPFGFRSRALAGGQRIAVETGINEKRNILTRYALCGALLGIAGVLHISSVLTMDAAKNMTSTGIMFGAMMPVIVGMTLARYSNAVVGVLMGVLSMHIISVGFTCAGINGTLSTIISGLFLLVFVLVTENRHKLFKRKRLVLKASTPL